MIRRLAVAAVLLLASCRTAPAPARRDVTLELYSWALHTGSAGATDHGVPETPLHAHAYSFEGLGWGRSWLWLDAQGTPLCAVVPNAKTSRPANAIRRGDERLLGACIDASARIGTAFYRAAARPVIDAPRYALLHARLIDGSGAAPVDDATIVIDRGVIAAAGAGVTVPAGIATIDLRGKTVIPGLWDTHAHVTQVEWGPAYLAAGVTTVRDLGNTLEFITALRDSEASGLVPHILTGGFIDGAEKTSPTGYQAATPADGVRLVDMYADARFDQIKVWNNVAPDVLKAIATRAHARGMTVTGHVPKAMNAFDAIAAGQDQIDHIDYVLHSLPSFDLDASETQAALRFFRDHHVVIEPTLPADEMFTRSLATPIETFEPGIAKTPPALVDTLRTFGVPAEQAAGAADYFAAALKTVGALHRLGVPIIAGTDMLVPGHSLHRSIELLVKSGLTPMEAIRAATSVPAQVLRPGGRAGTIAAGNAADLAILDADPLADIRNIRSVHSVVKGGVMYDSAALWKLAGFTP